MNLKHILAGASLAFLSTVSSAQAINFGIIATDAASTQRERWEPFFRDMEKKTGLTVKSFYAPDYAGVIEAMRFNKVQVAWFGNKSAMEAVDRSEGEVFAQVMYADGSFGYKAVLITQKDSPYKGLDDVFRNGKTINFGIGDPNSTSGFLVPTFYVFAKNQVDYRTAFKTIRNASHGANIQAVLAKQLDVATANTEEMTKLEASKPELAKQLRVIWESPLIPSDPFVWRKDLDPAVKAKLKAFVIGYAKTDPEEKAILKNIYDYGGFRASTNDQLVPIRQLELFKDRSKVENDANLDAAAKAKSLTEIDAKLARAEAVIAPSAASLELLRQRAAAERPGVTYYAGWIAALAVLAWAWQGAEMRPLDLLRDAGNIKTYAGDFFPPDFHDWRIYAREMVVTVHIAIWGTLLAVVAAVPMGLLCASNISPVWVHQPVRRVMDACRAINEMVFAMLFIVAVGLGPFAGVLALAVHTTGTLAKLFSEAVEAIDPRPVEGIRATGAHKLVEVLYGVVPQVLPLWVSFTLYRFESNVRSASVVGMVGAGGIGVVLFEVIRSFQYGQTCAVLIILVVTVSLIDLSSARLRSRFI